MRIAFVMLFAVAAGLVPAQLRAEQGAAAPAAQSAQRVRVQSFRFAGNTVVATEVLNTVVQPYQGKEQTLAELQAVAQSVAAYYHQQGFFLAKVVLPEQDVSAGVVTLRILEGKLGRIRFSGNVRYSEERLQAYFDKARDEGVLRQETLERALLLLNDLPGVKAASVLQAGEDAGTTDVTINVEETRPVSGTVEVSNFGSRYSRARMSVGANMATQRGDSFVVRAVSGMPPKQLFFGQASWSGPIGSQGLLASLYILNGKFGVGREFSALNIQGKATAIGASVSYPLVKTRRRTLTVDFGLDARDSKQDLLGFTSSFDRIRVAHLGVQGSAQDMNGRTLGGLSVEQGLGTLLGGMNDGDVRSSRAMSGADGSFTKVALNAARVQSLSPRSFLIARLSGQVSARSLVVGEQITLGGPDSVRGYSQSEYLGDHGVVATLEGRYAFRADQPDRMQGVLFADWGWVSVKKPAVGQTKSVSLTGIGFGIRATPAKGVSIRADLGFPLGKRPSSGGTIAPHLQVVSTF